MAVAAKMAEARFNTKEHTIFNHKIVCLAGDGCFRKALHPKRLRLADIRSWTI